MLLGVLLAALLIMAPRLAGAEDQPIRTGGAVGGFFRRVARALLPEQTRDDDLDHALETYAKGSYYTTFIHATHLRERNLDGFDDEANLLRGLSAAEANLRDEAVAALVAVLERPEVSPYYPVALAALLELEIRLGNSRAASAAASGYLADFWRRPSSAREATIKGVFLSTGNLSAMVESKRAVASKDVGMENSADDGPADRAVYLSGQALLAEKELEKAETCFAVITPRSPYFAYARYGLGQALYGLDRFAEAESMLAEIQSTKERRDGESYLKDKAVLLAAQILHERDKDSAAVAWLGRVSQRSPFALHAALLAAEIQADRDRPALALVYLQARAESAADPKLVARATVLDAELRRTLGDPDHAIAGLEHGIEALQRYTQSLMEAGDRDVEIDRLLRDLRGRQAIRDQIETWRRQNLSNAIPDLLSVSFEPGWLSRLVASVFSRRSAGGGYPVIYYPKTYDPFTALPAPRERELDPPTDPSFPSLFRRSFGRALSEAFGFERDLRTAIDEEDDMQLAFLLLDGDLRLAAISGERGEPIEAARIRSLGFGETVASLVGENRPRVEILARALRDATPLDPDPARHAMLAAAGGRQLDHWQELERALLRETVGAEAKTVQDLRYALEFELSQTLAVKKEAEKGILQPGALPAPPES